MCDFFVFSDSLIVMTCRFREYGTDYYYSLMFLLVLQIVSLNRPWYRSSRTKSRRVRLFQASKKSRKVICENGSTSGIGTFMAVAVLRVIWQVVHIWQAVYIWRVILICQFVYVWCRHHRDCWVRPNAAPVTHWYLLWGLLVGVDSSRLSYYCLADWRWLRTPQP